ncbi:MAG: tyrosine-protein phosphatase [Gammaproteobacteria bacterium]|nr:tyrosine-protein phosphatase [Gammaproteobacteria bacterium]
MFSCKRFFIKTIILISILFGLIALSFGCFLGFNYFTGNVHTVIPGKIYRSAQLDHSGLTYYTNKFHLKTIIDLRGRWPKNHWYEIESGFAKANHLHYFPIQFSAYVLPPKNKLQELVRVLQTAPKPLIFHCEGGADRTGMAAAISVILFEKNPTVRQIERQASWHYNAISKKTVGYQMLQNYFVWLKKNNEQSSKQHFLEWVNSPVKMKPYYGRFIV